MTTFDVVLVVAGVVWLLAVAVVIWWADRRGYPRRGGKIDLRRPW